ncbi:lantibiotic dehydratase [Streptomyces sp. TRM 70351]|uniref:lantibiotic dehydratase n=1 Tax=Streptomyces sp. TRM 70351 TaxID=3116552 RepID=UPI002E7C0278|nr:lantibiotic dehydratase [Streptomyces sp. TRM 70351]MEE1931019.1 lantibiotic dehydratase [Streptomyces sp. TRM 70351]
MRTPLYRHTHAALLRATAAPLSQAPATWPDLGDPVGVRAWLRRAWAGPETADAIRLASQGVADRIEAAITDDRLSPEEVRRIALSAARYLLRATGRPTPFGLFAGVAPVTVGVPAQAPFTGSHLTMARVDAQWLADITSRLESVDGLLDVLPVVFTDMAVRRGKHLHVPHGPDRVAVRYTSAVAAVRETAASPIVFHVLARELAPLFPTARTSTVRSMLTELVRQGFLITGLRAPLTEPDPLSHLINRLREARTEALPEVRRHLEELEAVRAELRRHNEAPAEEQRRSRTALTGRLRSVSPAGRAPLEVRLRLGCDVGIPRSVAQEAARAASVLVRLTREPTGPAAWRDWYTAFCERYGIGSLVPVSEAVHPDSGLGFPAGYPGSVFPAPRTRVTRRDEQLAGLAWQSLSEGSREVRLTDATVEALAGALLDERYIPAHVEVSVRVHAASAEAVNRGAFTLSVAPGRSAGTFTARFADMVPGLAGVYATLPTVTEGALAAQLSVPPVYPHAENISRAPAFLPHVISLGEHRGRPDGAQVIGLEDLALTASRERLHLVSVSRRREVEPQLFHALALEKQLVPLARFLAQVPRAGLAAWTGFDWGPHARLPFLPRVRYRRSILTPARWRLASEDLPVTGSTEEWRRALAAWRERWKCPAGVELWEDDRGLRLDLDMPLHVALVRSHLRRRGTAVLTEGMDTAATLGWISGHPHEIALPLVAAGPPAPDPLAGLLPLVTNYRHGQAPAAENSRWLSTRIPTHPERMNEIIADHLPRLLTGLGGGAAYWFVRYRSAHEPDHLRLRIRTPSASEAGAYAQVLARWADQLRSEDLAGPHVLDTYRPEIGRYGSGTVLDAAETVFAADSVAVAAQLRHLPPSVQDPVVLTVWGMVDIARGLLGTERSTEWFTDQPAPTANPTDRSVADHAVKVQPGALPGPVAAAWRARADALAVYATVLPAGMDITAVLESLLHMHHNRARGIDRDGEAVCRRLARQAALALRHRKEASAR